MNKQLRLIGVVVSFAASAAVGAAEAPKPTPPPGTRIQRDLQYVAGGHERNKLDLYLPGKTDRRLPVIVFIHGGGWGWGSKDDCEPNPYLAKGYAVASINYRFTHHAIFPAQIEDCKAAIRWLRANAKKYNLDPNHIGAWGGSAGGHLAALLGTSGDVKELEGKGGNLDQSSRVQCVLDFCGPTDFTRMGGWQDKPDSPMAHLVGGPVCNKLEMAAKANPINYITKDDPPFLIVHGDKDPAVPMIVSELLDEALHKAGIECTLIRVVGGGHGGPDFISAETQKKIDAFFEKHLK
jgi:acetyl esterase/lipase